VNEEENMSKNNLGETLIMGMPQQGRVQTQSMQANHHVIRLNCDITAPEDFNEELNILHNMTENDSCEILINTGGGYLATAMEFLDAMSTCEGHIHTRITGSAHSAGSIIFLAGHSFSLSDFSEMLIHNGEGGVFGKHSDWVSQSDHTRKHYAKMFHSFYKDFLTPEEIDDVLRGIDLWLDKDQIEERLQRMVEIRQQEAEEQAEAFIDSELDGCNDFDVDGVSDDISEDTSGHEYQLGSDLNNCCIARTCKSKPRFKVGDCVRVVSDKYGGGDAIGHKDIIVDIDGTIYKLNSGWCYEPEELELVSSGDDE
jgi:ATP-dependent protease ClpP protease subunit